MSQKNHAPGPVPPANRPADGPPQAAKDDNATAGGGAPFNEQDEKRRLGGFQTAGEHARVQPSPSNDGGSQQSRS